MATTRHKLVLTIETDVELDRDITGSNFSLREGSKYLSLLCPYSGITLHNTKIVVSGVKTLKEDVT